MRSVSLLLALVLPACSTVPTVKTKYETLDNGVYRVEALGKLLDTRDDFVGAIERSASDLCGHTGYRLEVISDYSRATNSTFIQGQYVDVSHTAMVMKVVCPAADSAISG